MIIIRFIFLSHLTNLVIRITKPGTRQNSLIFSEIEMHLALFNISQWRDGTDGGVQTFDQWMYDHLCSKCLISCVASVWSLKLVDYKLDSYNVLVCVGIGTYVGINSAEYFKANNERMKEKMLKKAEGYTWQHVECRSFTWQYTKHCNVRGTHPDQKAIGLETQRLSSTTWPDWMPREPRDGECHSLNVLLLVLYLSTAIQVDCQFSDKESHLLLLSFSHKQNSPPKSSYLLKDLSPSPSPCSLLFTLWQMWLWHCRWPRRLLLTPKKRKKRRLSSNKATPSSERSEENLDVVVYQDSPINSQL